MTRTRHGLGFFLGCILTSAPVLMATPFPRGDVNRDGFVDLNDIVGILRTLYGRGASFCMAAADANADGKTDLADAILLSHQVFTGEAESAWPLNENEDEDEYADPCFDPAEGGPVDEMDSEAGGGAGKSLLWKDDFNTTPPSGMGKYLYTAPPGSIQATKLSGQKCLMIQCTAGQKKDENKRVRSELSLWEPGRKSRIFKKDPIGSERWYAISIFVPKTWWNDSSKVEILQWHGSEDNGEKGIGRNPPLSLMVMGSNLIIRQLWSAKRIQTSNENRVDLWRKPLEKAQWMTFVFHMKWSYKKDGFLEVWKDGKKIIDQKNKPNCYNDALGPYFKFGAYWPTAGESNTFNKKALRTLYYDSLRIGDGRNVLKDLAR